MSTYKHESDDIAAFTQMIRAGMPALIEQGTRGDVVQTADRDLLPQTANGEAAFAIVLSNGVSYRVRVQQIGEAEDEEAGCRRCGTVTPIDELDGEGACADCAGEEWSRLTAEQRTAWCKVNRMHYPYEDKGPMAPEQLTYVSDLLAAHPFRLAKTMPKNPHEYTLRHEWADVGGGVFEEVVRMIREHGYTEWFGTYPWRMLNANGYKYWTYFSSYVEEVIVLNRKEPEGRHRRRTPLGEKKETQHIL